IERLSDKKISFSESRYAAKLIGNERGHYLDIGEDAPVLHLEQWDKPNGWAPLQWMAIQGFKLYGDDMLGDEIAHNWLKTVNH
ncbi:hypothetical protein MJN85_32860, partial [Salmonella enterica subsp. enterica serovar Anatum]|nr:hypothetical protein [Salmonella enterica subsp. enterica serovar Anatum]